MRIVEYNWELALISILLFLLMFALARPYNTFISPQSNNVHKNLLPFFVVFGISNVFAFWEHDTYHYWESFVTAGNFGKIEAYEGFYNWLAEKCNNNFFLWRACIWIPATCFMYYTAKRLKLSNRNLLLAIILFGSMLSLTRAMLGHTMLLFAAVLLIDKKSTHATKIVGLALFCLSYYLHKSMFVNMIFVVLALYPLNKSKIIISLAIFPFMTAAATMLINNMVGEVWDLALAEDVGGYGDRSLAYASAEQMELNTNGKILQLIINLPQYFALVYLTNRIIFKEYFKGIRQERVYKYLFRLSYVSIYIASLFIFVKTSSWIYIRFKYMGLFPLVFVLAKVFSLEPRANKWVKWVILLQVLSMTINLSLRIYKWYNL